MSFHDMPELLEEILEKYGDRMDFVQLQINLSGLAFFLLGVVKEAE